MVLRDASLRMTVVLKATAARTIKMLSGCEMKMFYGSILLNGLGMPARG
jgi:hypothetical protein